MLSSAAAKPWVFSDRPRQQSLVHLLLVVGVFCVVVVVGENVANVGAILGGGGGGGGGRGGAGWRMRSLPRGGAEGRVEKTLVSTRGASRAAMSRVIRGSVRTPVRILFVCLFVCFLFYLFVVVGGWVIFFVVAWFVCLLTMKMTNYV